MNQELAASAKLHRFAVSEGSADGTEALPALSSEREISGTRSSSILLVDDDLDLALDITGSLTQLGYQVSHAATGPDGLTQARRGGFDLLILDRMLEGEDGLTILKLLRREAVDKPVIILSALGGIEDRVRGLDAGGDDYLVKPFSTDELVARVGALLRRTNSARTTSLQLGQLKLDLIDRRVWRADREIELLPREFKLLEYFMHRPGQIVTRTMLLEDVWQYRFIPETRLVDVHISKLRRKIDTPGEPPMLLSIRSAGFMLNAPA